MKKCRKCNVELVADENWWPSFAKNNNRICIECARDCQRQYHTTHGGDWLTSYCQREVIKNCRKCGDELVVDENWYASVAKHNDCICIACKKTYTYQYCEEHQEKIANYRRQYYQEHKEEIEDYKRQYYREHKKEREERAAYQRKYGPRWNKENPDKKRESSRRYRARKLNATVEDVDEQKIYELYDSACVYCGSKENLELDHIVPLNGDGSHCQDNLVVACRSCNSSKSDTPLEEWLQIRPDLQVWVI